MSKKGRPTLERKKDKMLVLKVHEDDRRAMHDFVKRYNEKHNTKYSLSAMMLNVFSNHMKRNSLKLKNVSEGIGANEI